MQRTRISSRLFDTYISSKGERFLAFMERPEFSSASPNAPKRVFHVRKPSRIKVGDLVLNPTTREYYLLGLFQSEYPSCLSFKAFQVTQIYSWFKQEYTEDLVTKFKKKGLSTKAEDIYTTIEPLKEVGFFGFSEQISQFVTNQPVSAGDMVGTFLVKSVTESNGLFLVVTQPK